MWFIFLLSVIHSHGNIVGHADIEGIESARISSVLENNSVALIQIDASNKIDARG
jgi:hypothetical protein